MPESDFLEIIITELEDYIPTFTTIYRSAELTNEPWDLVKLKKNLKVLAEKGKLKTEPAKLAEIAKKEANKKNNPGAKKAMPYWQTTGYGVDDQSDHNYAADAFYEGEQVTQDGMQRNDATTYYMGEQYSGRETSHHWHQQGDGKGKGGAYGKGGDGKGKGGAYPYGKGGDGKGKGKGGKGKGGEYPYGKGKGGKGSKGENKRWNDGGGYDNSYQWNNGKGNGGAWTEWNKVPAKQMWCTICAWHNKTRNAAKHDNATCMLPGGGMEGATIDACIWEQRRLNMIYYDAVRNGEMKEQQATATTKKARTENEDEEESNEKANIDEETEEEENNKANNAAIKEWFTSSSKMTKISIDETLLTISSEAQQTTTTPPPTKEHSDNEIYACNEQRKYTTNTKKSKNTKNTKNTLRIQ